MKKKERTFIRWFIFFCILLLTPITTAFASEIDFGNWMGNLSDDTSISSLSIPGTHDSCATKGIKIPLIGKDYGKCQYGSPQTVISDQLNVGCRYLDIRCRYISDDTFAIHHGDIYQNLNFGDVLNQCQNFLNNHPSETIFMRVKQEKSSVSDFEFKKTFFSYVNRYPSLFWNDRQNKNLKLGDIRGKVVVLYNVCGLDFGLDYSTDFDIQDNYDTSSVDVKWESFYSHLKKDHPKSSINYLSAAGNAKKTPEDLAKKLNPKLIDELRQVNYSNVGIIAADFMTKNIAEEIVKINLKQTNCTYKNTTYRISPVCDQTKCLDNNANNEELFVWSKVEKAENHYFTFHFIKEDIVKISSKDNSRWLTTNGQIGSTITQTNNEQEASYWKIKQLGNNKVALHYMGNKEVEINDSNLSLNICGGNATDGTKAILYPSSYDSYTNQQFILEEN